MINVMKKLLLSILLLITFSLPSYAVADVMDDMEKMSSQLKKVNKNISRGQFEGEDLTAWTKLTINMKSAASLCNSNSETALIDLKTVMDGLGEKVKGEDAEVTKKRATYQKQKAELDKTLAKCNLFVVSSGEVAKLINVAEKSYFKQKYLARSPHMLDLILAYLENPVAILQESGAFIFKRSGINEIMTLSISICRDRANQFQ